MTAFCIAIKNFRGVSARGPYIIVYLHNPQLIKTVTVAITVSSLGAIVPYTADSDLVDQSAGVRS